MANHKSALKRHRQSLKARARNMHYRSMARTAVKKARNAPKKDQVEAFRDAASVLAHVAAKGVIPRRRAARKISRLARALNQTA
ncbi:30S ribosomal protein S20 [Myxococcota bacterium]|nr:30S ribosomal protein S20 [Myxococcota bacterium]